MHNIHTDRPLHLDCSVPGYVDHHFKQFYGANHPVVLCTDDSGEYSHSWLEGVPFQARLKRRQLVLLMKLQPACHHSSPMTLPADYAQLDCASCCHIENNLWGTSLPPSPVWL